MRCDAMRSATRHTLARARSHARHDARRGSDARDALDAAAARGAASRRRAEKRAGVDFIQSTIDARRRRRATRCDARDARRVAE